MINCKRNNVYNIFKRNDISIQQLKDISEVLRRNFFAELSKDMDIITPIEETDEMKSKRNSISYFMEIVPDLLEKMNLPATIVFPHMSKEYCNCPVPDFAMPDFGLTFTIGDTLKSRIGENSYVTFNILKDENGYQYEFVKNEEGDSFINIPVKDYKSEDWTNIFNYIFKNLKKIM